MSISQLPDDIFYEETKHWYDTLVWIGIGIMMPFAMLFAEIWNWRYEHFTKLRK